MSTVELVGAISSIVQGFAVVIASCVGYLGLNTWRRQMSGGKKLELAEETLIAAHEAYAAIERIRMPWRRAGEGATLPVASGEDTETTAWRRERFVPYERLVSEEECFRRLAALRVRCRVHFGLSAAPYLEALLEVPIKIREATSWLTRHPNAPRACSDSDAVRWRERTESCEEVIWDHEGPATLDDFTKKLVGALEGLELVLIKHLRDK